MYFWGCGVLLALVNMGVINGVYSSIFDLDWRQICML